MFRRAVLVLGLLGLAACWNSYAGRARVHAELLIAMADKLMGQVEAHIAIKVETMGEYVYPGQRAGEFLKTYSGYSEYESYRRLSELVTLYDAFVKRVDTARAGASEWNSEIDALRRERDELHRSLAAVNESLDARR